VADALGVQVTHGCQDAADDLCDFSLLEGTVFVEVETEVGVLAVL
jgi:hypothetical protein